MSEEKKVYPLASEADEVDAFWCADCEAWFVDDRGTARCVTCEKKSRKSATVRECPVCVELVGQKEFAAHYARCVEFNGGVIQAGGSE